MNQKSNTQELVITRILDIPIAWVWKGWTDPKLVALWWGPAHTIVESSTTRPPITSTAICACYEGLSRALGSDIKGWQVSAAANFSPNDPIKLNRTISDGEKFDGGRARGLFLIFQCQEYDPIADVFLAMFIIKSIDKIIK
ncbi:hypothetical protein [Paenibacillus sp. GCM10027626]|uniref:hypothetical protein n=1 Tax=Paenibacillus sp. GCM10027626 TaxID=3273411 RepID=UPI0036439ADD